MKYLLFAFFVSGISYAEVKPEKIGYSSIDQECTATFDSNKYAVQEIKNASMLSFEVGSSFPLKSLSSCNQKLNPKYKDCGSRHFGSENFLHNAQINMDSNAEFIADIEAKKVPADFQAMKARIVARLHQWQSSQTLALKFLTSQDLNILKTAEVSCQDKISGLNAKSSASQVDSAVLYDWMNCLNTKSKAITQEELEASWQKLLLTKSCEDPMEDRD